MSAFEALSFIFNNKKLAIFVVEWMKGKDGKVDAWTLLVTGAFIGMIKFFIILKSFLKLA